MKLLVTGALSCDERCLGELRALGHEVLVADDERGPLPAGAHEAEGIVCNGLFLHHEAARFPNPRFVQLTSAGLDRAPVSEFAERGVALFNAKGVYSIPLAEWVVMQLLNIYKRARFFEHNQQQRRWQKARDLRELAGRTACIVGFGDVGREVAKRLRGFDVRIIGVDLLPAESPLADRVVGIDALTHVLPEADFVVLTVPLTPDTRHLVDDDMLAVMKQDAVLVNVSRGAVVDEDALVRALDRGQFRGVALDVFEQETLAEHSPLWGHERVLVTPHNSFVSDRVQERLVNRVLANMSLAMVGEPANPEGGHRNAR